MTSEAARQFYNDRAGTGYRAPVKFGSQSFPPYLAEPYLLVEKKLQGIKTRSDQNMKLLDVCCGNGVHSLVFAQMGYSVAGCDISEKLLENATQAALDTGLDRHTTFCKADLFQRFPYDDDSFDVVYISGSLYYLDRHFAISEIKRVLKKGGYFCCIETNGDNVMMNAVRKIKNKIWRHRDQDTLEHLMTRQDVAQIAADFSHSEIRYFGFLTLFASLLKFSPMLLKIWTSLMGVVDGVLLNKLGLSIFGFKFVVIGRNNKS